MRKPAIKYSITLMLLAVCHATGAERVVKIASESTYEFDQEGWFWSKSHKVEKITSYGTGFVLNYAGERFVVTACHVILGLSDAKEIKFSSGAKLDLVKNSYTRSIRIRVGSIPVTPVEIALDQLADVAVLKLKASDLVSLELDSYLPRAPLPEVGTKLEAWGYPPTDPPKTQKTKSAPLPVEGKSTTNQNEYIGFSASLAPGYSGGPLISSRSDVVAIVSRESRAVPIRFAMELINPLHAYTVMVNGPEDSRTSKGNKLILFEKEGSRISLRICHTSSDEDIIDELGPSWTPKVSRLLSNWKQHSDDDPKTAELQYLAGLVNKKSHFKVKPHFEVYADGMKL